MSEPLRQAPKTPRFFTLCILLSLCFFIFQEVTAFAQPMGVGGPRPRPSVPKKEADKPVRVSSPDLGVLDDFDMSQISDGKGTVTKILVQGNRKIETDSVLSHLRTKLGGFYSDTLVREDVARLFKTGYFYDIKVDRSIDNGEPTPEVKASPKEADKAAKEAAEKEAAGETKKEDVKGKPEVKEPVTGPAPHYKVTYIVVEKPSIVEILFEGTSELKNEELLETSGLKNYEILSQSKIRDAVEKMQKMYEDKGFFLARIEPKVEDVKPGETVRITFNVHENDKVKVKKITLLGNNKLKDGYLKGRMITQEGGFFSFMSGSGGYKQDAFDRDMQLLRVLYFNEGYVQVKIDRPKVYVTPDKKSIYITIRIEEGEQFDVGEIDFSGDLLFSKDELANSINLNKRKTFSYEVLQKDLGDLQAKYGDLGYAFANVIPRTRTNEKERKVDVTFEFDKGHKVYFGQINVIGNSKTRDKVLRRELKIFEGELYHETRKRQSQENIQRLGYFEDVTFKTSTPPDKPDILNIDIVVKERNTGSIQLGAGYGSATGFSLQGQIQQANFLGYGQKMGAGVTISQLLTTYFFNFTEPHYNDTDWSAGFDLYQSAANRFDYFENIKGGAVRVGHPLAEFLNLTFRYRYDITWLDVESVTPAAINGVSQNSVQITDQTLFPLSTAQGDTGSLSTILEYDKRNDRIAPSNGIYASASYEYAGIGGSLKYSKGSTGLRYYKKLFWDLVWRNNLTYSFLMSNDGNPPPFNQKFLLGGPYTLRGYQFARVGKTKFGPYYYSILPTINPGISPSDQLAQANRPVGGNQQALYQLEFEFPLIAEANIKGVTFYDAGIADDSLDASNIYSDVGFGFRWFSPIGPLRFEWGFPSQQTVQSPNPVQFQFSIGAPF